MTSSFLYKKRIHTDDEGLDSLVVISFRSWVLWLACVLVLVALIIWSFTSSIDIHVPKKNSANYTVNRQAPITLVFPITHRWLHECV